jgi:hypothetical protein
VQKTISEIVPSKDPLDSPDFNYIDYINKLFPTEQSLEKLDDEIKRIKIKIQRVDEEIMSSVYKQSRAGMKGKQELERAKKSIQELFAKIKEIKSKASESEQMVQDICRDICDLDFAKKNLTTSMTALKRLHDLITMLEQLKVMAEKRQYREVGNLYEGVTQILILFNDYKEVAKIKELQSEVETLKAQLQKQIYDEFENPNLKHLDQHEIMNLSNACFVVDALGSETRREVMNRFCQKILTNYQRDFKDGTEVAKLEHTDKRYTWLVQHFFEPYDNYFSKIFPSSWRLKEFVTEEFCFLTREKISELLEQNKTLLAKDIRTLTKALKKTLAFERELTKIFTQKLPEDVQNDESSSQEATPPIPQAPEMLKFKGIISSAFTPYLYIYIQDQEAALHEMFTGLLTDEKWILEEDAPVLVLISASDMITHFMTARDRCAALNKGQAFFDLFKLFKKYLELYGDKLKEKLSAFDVNAMTNSNEVTVCLIINTANYMDGVLQKIEISFKNTIEPPFKEKIDLETTTAKYKSVVAQATNLLVKVLENLINPVLQKMATTSWEKITAVSVESEYTHDLTKILEEKIPFYRKWITAPERFQFLCDAFVTVFLPALYQTLFKCKRLNDLAHQQLLLDIVYIRKLIETLPVIGLPKSTPCNERYVKRVKRELDRIEKIIRLVIGPVDILVESYKTNFPDHNETELVKIMDLKYIRKQDQEHLLDQYGSPKDSPARLEIRSALQETDKTNTIRKLFNL